MNQHIHEIWFELIDLNIILLQTISSTTPRWKQMLHIIHTIRTHKEKHKIQDNSAPWWTKNKSKELRFSVGLPKFIIFICAAQPYYDAAV